MLCTLHFELKILLNFKLYNCYPFFVSILSRLVSLFFAISMNESITRDYQHETM
jgi:hypothetical protein